MKVYFLSTLFILSAIFCAAQESTQDCMEPSRLVSEHDPVKVIALELRVDSIYYMGSNHSINFNKEITLKKESKLIKLNDQFAFKFFRVIAFEHGFMINLVKYEFFVFDQGCWRHEHSSSYGEMGPYAKYGWFSVGSRMDDPGFYKVYWDLSRLN